MSSRTLSGHSSSAKPGWGKSRLLDDLREWLDTRPERLRLLRGRAYPGDASQPYALVRRIWFDRFRITEDEPLASAEEKWVQAFQKLAQTDQIEPAQALGLAGWVELSGQPASRRDERQPKPGQRARRGSQPRGLERHPAPGPPGIFARRPALGRYPSLEYLTDVVFQSRPVKGNPCKVNLCLPPPVPNGDRRRPGGVLPGLSHPAYFEIRLDPLIQAASQELVMELLQRVDGVSDEVIRLIVERAEGVPYYAEELVNLLIDRGVIDASTDRWRFLSERLDPAQLPLTLQHLLLTRLLSLPIAERHCLQRGSIFGRNFWEGGLEALGYTRTASAAGTTATARFC